MPSGPTGPPEPLAAPHRRDSITVSYEARDYLAAHAVDPSLERGARTADRTCLGLMPEQRLVLVAEKDHEPIAAPLLQAAEADGSILVASVGGLPAAFRRRLVDAGGERRRHAHMAGLTEAMMRQAMRADYEEVHTRGERLLRMLRPESVLTVETTGGTELTTRCTPEHRWHDASGLLREPGWTNLPGGEVFTTPVAVDGLLVPDGGAWLPDGRGLARASRLRLRFAGGELAGVDGPDREGGRALSGAVADVSYGRRVGQVGFGTNTGVLASIGSLLQDLEMPGFHVSLGHTWAELTGAGWNSPFEIPPIVRRPDVLVDGTPIMVRGRYARGLL